ncbi:Gfo/Idh/MocA family oxidoreductase [Eoetvoesiella caeni]
MDKKPIGLGVVGLGRAFTLMLPTFLQDDRVQMVAATDPRAGARDMFRSDFNAPAYQTLEELCRDSEVEAVYIASPHQFHADHVQVVAAAGKAILVEKPLAISMEDCTRIVELADRAKAPIIVGHSHSFNGPVLHAASLLSSGRFGGVRMLNALNYTDFLYRSRRPEELDTQQGGGVVFSQAAHQIDIVRLLMGGLIDKVRACTGKWDSSRPTEGAYMALLTARDGAFASVTYSGYAHFDSDELMGNVGEMGYRKQDTAYGAARLRILQIDSAREADLKVANNYGGEGYGFKLPPPTSYHQHFGPVIITAERADIRLTPEGLMIYGDAERTFVPTPKGLVPRAEVIDELWCAVRLGLEPLHSARWARATTEICIALLESARTGEDVTLRFQVAPSRFILPPDEVLLRDEHER